jgi:hypothetical protein
MNHQKIYKLTSIGRPVDPAYPTNKAVLVILPLVLFAGFGLALLKGVVVTDATLEGLRLALIAFGGWALARELAPDDQAAAFVCMFLATLGGLWADEAGILIVFATLGLVRLVNRSTGLQAKLSDSFILILLAFLVVYSTESPFYALVATVAFLLDGMLRDPVRRHWIFAIFSFIGMVVYMVDHDVSLEMITAPDTLAEWLSVLFLVLFAFMIILLPKPAALGDIGRKTLSRKRVRGGMLVALLALLQGLNLIQDVVVIACVIAGVCLGSVFRKSFSNPAPSGESSELE